jgi:serine/threonine protein kinase
MKKNGLPEKIVRKYFRDIIDTIYYIHSQGFAHRDIKLENLILDNNFQLKLIDFGFSCDVKKKLLRKKVCGTKLYIAPEISINNQYDPQIADIFSLGVLLFAMSTSKFPFDSQKSHLFIDIKKGKFSRFWTLHSMYCKNTKIICSNNFKTLIEGMIATNPKERFSLKDIINSDWVQNGEIATEKEIFSYFNK